MAKVELDIPSYLRAGSDNLPVGEIYVKDNVEEGTLGDIISGFGKTKPVKMADMPAQPKVFDEQEPMIDELERTPLPGAPNMPILPPRTPDINVMPQAPGIQDPKELEKTRMDIAQLPKDDILIS
jgi:hypothetical protein